MQAKTLLLRAYHRGSLAEVDDDNREAAARLVGLGYAGDWRTQLGAGRPRVRVPPVRRKAP